jgi:hypothetical protein
MQPMNNNSSMGGSGMHLNNPNMVPQQPQTSMGYGQVPPPQQQQQPMSMQQQQAAASSIQHLQRQQQQQLQQMLAAQNQQRPVGVNTQQQQQSMVMPGQAPQISMPPPPQQQQQQQQQQPQMVVDPQLQNLPIRAYLDQTVVPILLDGNSISNLGLSYSVRYFCILNAVVLTKNSSS